MFSGPKIKTVYCAYYGFHFEGFGKYVDFPRYENQRLSLSPLFGFYIFRQIFLTNCLKDFHGAL